MISKRYIISGDAMEAILGAMEISAKWGNMNFYIGETGCILFFASHRDLMVFRLAAPIGWTGLICDSLSVIVAADPPEIHAVVDPILERLDLQARVVFAEFAEIYLPTDDDHDRLLWAIQEMDYCVFFA